MNIKTAKINVSNHAVIRLKQRFRTRFFNYFQHTEMTRNLITAQVMNAKVLEDWKQVPFYVNKMGTKHGVNVEILYKSGVYYVCNYVAGNNTLHVRTCVTKICHYQPDKS